MNPPRRLLLGSSLAALALASCGGHDASAAPRGSSHHFITITDTEGGTDLEIRMEDGQTLLTLDGVEFDVDEPMKLDYELLAGGATRWPRTEAREGLSDSPTGVWIQYLPLDLRDGHLRIGQRDYGAVSRGATVEVDAEGVAVDGEHRGDLP